MRTDHGGYFDHEMDAAPRRQDPLQRAEAEAAVAAEVAAAIPREFIEEDAHARRLAGGLNRLPEVRANVNGHVPHIVPVARVVQREQVDWQEWFRRQDADAERREMGRLERARLERERAERAERLRREQEQRGSGWGCVVM